MSTNNDQTFWAKSANMPNHVSLILRPPKFASESIKVILKLSKSFAKLNYFFIF